MNWLSNFLPPRIRSFVSEQKEVPDNLWQKCPSCEAMLFHRDLKDNLNVCYHCNHHLRLSVADRLELLYDDGKYENVELPSVATDPLKFKDRKRYTDRVKDAQSKTGLKDAITVSYGTINGIPSVIAAFNFRYMGGSMGTAVGEALIKASEVAIEKKAAFITVPASGGARMQEGMLSLMQMPRSIIAVEMVKEQKLPYVVILTDPTTGGVSASFAMLGDIHIAEPGAQIGFAGRRVIEETVRETLPDDFQTAEYLLEHGMVDMVLPRRDMKDKLSVALSILMKTPLKKPSPRNNKQDNKTENSGEPKNDSKAIKQAINAQQQIKAAKKAIESLKQNSEDVTGAKKYAAQIKG